MARFDRYVLSQLVALFGFFSLVLVGVYWVNRAVALFDQIISDGQSAGVFLELTALTLPNVIRLVLPVSAFAASVWVTNRLATESELVVAQAAGLGPFRLARAPLVFGLIVALLVALLAHWIVPASRAALSERQSEIARNVSARFLVEGRFMHPAEGLTVYIREIGETGELKGVLLSDSRRPGSQTTYTAARALLVRAGTGPKLVMVDGLAQTLDRETGRLATTRFTDFAYDLAGLIGTSRQGRRDERELPTGVLLAPDAAALAATGKPASVLLYEGHARLAQPLLGLVGALLGFAALLSGGFSRFGFWRQVALAVAALVLIQLLDNAVADRALSDTRFLPLVYLPGAAGLAAAAGLLAWSGRRRRMPRRAAPSAGAAA
ncbi:MAG: LPS export ABC transporter permease LptF [Rhodobacteraceae bacterium]|nr:LPS export ABC transporter permease LptF [Paracoccaceae bacterium]